MALVTTNLPSDLQLPIPKDNDQAVLFYALSQSYRAILNAIESINTASGGAPLTVEEQDGAPTVADVIKIKFPNGKVTDNGSGVVSVAIGDGDVVGPASATDNAIALFDGTTGKLIKDSTVLVSSLGTVGGTGTDNHLMRWNGTDDAQDSNVIVDDRGQISNVLTISTDTPTIAAYTSAERTTGTNFTQPLVGLETHAIHSSGSALNAFGLKAYALDSSGGGLSNATGIYAEGTDWSLVTASRMMIGGGGALVFNGVAPATDGSINAYYSNIYLGPSALILKTDGEWQAVGSYTTTTGGFVLGADGAQISGQGGTIQFNADYGGDGKTISFISSDQVLFSQDVGMGSRFFTYGDPPTARLHILYNMAAAGTAPLKFDSSQDNGGSGLLMTTPESGAFEFSSNLRFTNYSLNRLAIGGTLFDHYADVGNVTTGEDDLYTDTLLANTLFANGDKVTAQYSGIFAAHATATRQIKAYFGGTLIYDSTAIITAAAADWALDILVERESSTVVRCAVKAVVWPADAAVPTVKYTRITGLTLSNTQIIKITGEAASTGAATDDIIAKVGYGELKPAK